MEPQIHHLSFSGLKMAFFELPKHYVLKGKRPILKRKNTIKQGKKRQKDKWYPFHRVYTPPPKRAKKRGKTAQMSKKSSRYLIDALAGGGGNAILWTKRFYAHPGVPDCGQSMSVPQRGS